MDGGFINYDILKGFAAEKFRAKEPFPWANLREFLTPEGFRTLYRDFPPLELFERHQGIERAYGQRPHNRYYLAYETSIYHGGEPRRPDKGVLAHEQLPASWQRFMEELETSEGYRDFIREALGVENFKTRYAWHVGFAGTEVSPHVDASEKFGTHIIYFNTSEDWRPEWGGGTLVLGGKQADSMNPDFADFATCEEAQIVDNHSFLFKNTTDAWHGAKPLACPPGKFRRLFNVIFESPEAGGDRGVYLPPARQERGLLGRALSLLRR